MEKEKQEDPDQLSFEDYKAIVRSKVWKKWDKEQDKRWKRHIRKKSKMFSGCWDMSETEEIGLMSREHLIDFVKWLIKKCKKLKN